MYIAQRVLTIEGGRRVQPGEPIPDADKWQESVIRAHLNLGWIVKREHQAADTTVKTASAPTTEAPKKPAKKGSKKKGA